MTSSQFITVEHLPNAVIITILEGSVIRAADISRVCEEITAIVNQTSAATYVLSFVELTHMSSTFMGHLIVLNRRIRQRKARLVLVDLQPQIREVLTIAQVHKQIPIHDSLRDALVGRSPAWMALLGVSVAAALGGLITAIAWALHGLPGFNSAWNILASVTRLLLIALLPSPLLALRWRSRFSFLFRGEQWAVVAVVAVLLLLLIGLARMGE